MADVVSGAPVDFTWEAGTVRVPHVDVDANGVRVFGVDRGDFVSAIGHWFAQKRKYESRPETPAPVEKLPTPPPSAAVAFGAFHFRTADESAKTDLSWLGEPTTGAAWKDAGEGFWDEMGYPAKGIGLYRTEFRAPGAWRGKRVLLACASWDYPVFLEHATFYVNGEPAGEYRGHAWANLDVLDITAHVREGDNSLGVLVEATEVRGGYIGQLVAFPLENLREAHDLKAGWRLFKDNVKSAPVELPLDAEGRHLEAEVELAADWPEDGVFLEFEVGDRCLRLVVINGRPIAYNQFLHPYPNIMQVNLYPWAKPGQVNRIELWPDSLEAAPTRRMIVRNVRVGAVEGGEGR